MSTFVSFSDLYCFCFQLQKTSPAPISNAPLALIDPSTLELNRTILYSTRLQNQPEFVKNAVRRAARLSTHPVRVVTKAGSQPETALLEDLSIRDRLLERIANLASTEPGGEQYAGVVRQVRHSGVYNAGRNAGGARAEQKEIVRSVVSNVRIHTLIHQILGLRIIVSRNSLNGVRMHSPESVTYTRTLQAPTLLISGRFDLVIW